MHPPGSRAAKIQIQQDPGCRGSGHLTNDLVAPDEGVRAVTPRSGHSGEITSFSKSHDGVRNGGLGKSFVDSWIAKKKKAIPMDWDGLGVKALPAEARSHFIILEKI